MSFSIVYLQATTLNHLPAVKTGANSLIDNKDSSIVPILPNVYDLSTQEEDSSAKSAPEDVVTDDCATPDVMSVEMLSSPSVSSSSSTTSEEDVSSSDESGSLDDDDGLLGLLAETLDYDFDPNLLCFD